jgi:SAM-dependent methyltransferase
VYTALKRENTHTLMACSTCGDVFLYELEEPGDIYGDGAYFFSEYERQYGKSYVDDRENISRLGEERLDTIERCIMRRARKRSGLPVQEQSPQQKKLLDVGCALGFFMDVARRRGWMPTGVEISPFAARWVRENLGFSVINASFFEIQFQPESFDVITFFFVAEHFKDVEKVIERAYTVLKRGGLITFALPNRAGISYRIDRERYVSEHPRDHYFDTSPRNLIRLLHQYGFRKRRVRTTGIHPERFFRKLGMGRTIFLLNAMYTGIARVMRLGDTFEYYGVKIQ